MSLTKQIEQAEREIYKNFEIKKSGTGLVQTDYVAITVKEIKQFLTSQITEAYKSGLEEAISYIGEKEGWEESEDFYRRHFGFKEKYNKLAKRIS